jgi:hypothetical protein
MRKYENDVREQIKIIIIFDKKMCPLIKMFNHYEMIANNSKIPKKH